MECSQNSEELSRCAVIRNVVGEPTLTPDNNRVLFLQKDTLCIFDPRHMAIQGAYRVGEIPEDAQLAIHPTFPQPISSFH